MQDSLLNSVSELRSEQIPVWIVCCGMKRSGSTLQYQLAGSIVEKAGIGRLVGTVLPQEFATLRVSYASANGFLVVKSHSYIGELAPFFESGH